jgi:glucose dehydrogenase
MNWIVTTGVSAYAILAAVPVAVVGMALSRRLAWYFGLLMIGAGIWYAVWRYFPDLGLLVYAAMAAVPIVVTGVFLLRQPGRRRTIGAITLMLVAILLVYSIIAARLSHARDTFDGVTDLPSYLGGQAWVRDSLNDPDSAHFKDLWFNKSYGKWSMCGEVNARNRMGGLVGYTRFYVGVSDVLHRVTFDQDGAGFDDFANHCFSEGWKTN